MKQKIPIFDIPPKDSEHEVTFRMDEKQANLQSPQKGKPINNNSIINNQSKPPPSNTNQLQKSKQGDIKMKA